MAAQFHWEPETYLELIKSEVPRYEELQEATIEAIPFAAERVLELGIGTGETTRHLLARHPGARVTGLDSSPEMVFRARELGVEEVPGADRGPVARRPLGPGDLGAHRPSPR